MSKIKTKIELIATEVYFKELSIIYTVEIKEDIMSAVICCDNICNKDLTLKPTIMYKGTNKVVFTTDNATSSFYARLLKKEIKESYLEEYSVELEKIYSVGDCVGYVICD